jgi:hypothetical protein
LYKDIILDEWGIACPTRAFSGFLLGMMKNDQSFNHSYCHLMEEYKNPENLT